MSDEMKDPQTTEQNTEQEFLDFVPPVVEPEVEVETEPSAFDTYLAEKEKRDAKALLEVDTMRFQGVRSGQVAVGELDAQWLTKLEGWSKNRLDAAKDKFKGVPRDTRMDAYIKFYEESPEVLLFIQHLEKTAPEKYKAFVEGESNSSYCARLTVGVTRDRAERQKKESPEYQAQVRSAANATLHKTAQNDPNYFVVRDSFKGGYPDENISRLLTNKETRNEGLRLCALAVKLGYMPPDSQLSRSALDFVRTEQSESSFAVDPVTNATAVWSQLMPEGSISAEDRARAFRLWKTDGGADVEWRLKKDNPAEHQRMLGIGRTLGLIPTPTAKPVFNTSSDDLGPVPRPGSPAFFEFQKKVEAKHARLAELQRGKKNPHMKF